MLIFTKSVKIEAYQALAEIGVSSQREEILAILKLATELDGHVKASDINTKLLGRPEESPHGQRILMVLESYGLLERTGARENAPYIITQAGYENLSNGQIMVPEEGSYILFTTTDPLFKEAILRIDRAPFVERSEAKSYFDRKKGSLPEVQTTRSVQKPSYLDKYKRGYVFRQAANSNKTVQVNSISDRVAPSSRNMKLALSLELELDVDAKMKVQTIGDTSSQDVYTETTFNKLYTEVLEVLTTDIGRIKLIDNEPVLLVGWDKVKPQEAERFRKEINVNEPSLWEFGSFEAVNFTLPILPETQRDAIKWANYLLRNNITTYVDESEYIRIRNDVALKFRMKFDPNSLAEKLVTFEEMVHQVIQEKNSEGVSECYWYLLAPKDLSIR